MELRQSPEWGKYLESLGWQTEIIDGCTLRIKKLGPFGSIIKIQRPETLPLEKIEAVAKRRRVLFVKVEPSDETQSKLLIDGHYSPDSWPLNPTRTLVIDLSKSEEDLLKSFSKDARQTLRKLSSIGLDPKGINPSGTAVTDFREFTEEKESQLKAFHQIWRQTGKRGHFYTHSYKELLNKATAMGEEAVLIGSWGGTLKTGLEMTGLLAGCLLLFYDETAYYHHAASTLEGQKLEVPYAIMWQAIRESKNRGMKKLDLEGIFDPRFKFMNTKAWHNFSTFKLKWGGQVLEYPGSYIKVYNPLVKLLFWLEKFAVS